MPGMASGSRVASWAAVLALVGLIAGCAREARPNVIVILADDLGYGDLGSYGQEFIATPNLDRMAEQGLRFTNFHAGSAVCLPSRCTLMTGLHTGHCRIHKNSRGGSDHDPLAEEDVVVAAVLRAAGYRTAMLGKWALGDEFLGNVEPARDRDGPGAVYKHGWDYYFGEPNQSYNQRYYPSVLYEHDHTGLLRSEPTGDRLVPVAIENQDQPTRRRYSHDLLTEKALSFIDASRDELFFLYLPYQIVHLPLVVPELEGYAEDADWSAEEKKYASMVTRMDRDIGKIVRRLEEHGIAERTLLIFTSDNGAVDELMPRFRSTGGLPGGKAELSDGGVMVPFIARWPGGIEPGGVSDELLAFWDVLPTLAELAGIEPPVPLDGISFLPTLRGATQAERHDYLYWRFRGEQRVKRRAGESRSEAEILAGIELGVVVPSWEGGSAQRVPRL